MADENKEAEPLWQEFPGRLITPIFFNSFYMAVQPLFTRLTLGETVYSNVPPNYNAAVVLPTAVAVDMAQKMLQLAIKQGFVKIEDIRLTSPEEADPIG